MQKWQKMFIFTGFSWNRNVTINLLNTAQSEPAREAPSSWVCPLDVSSFALIKFLDTYGFFQRKLALLSYRLK